MIYAQKAKIMYKNREDFFEMFSELSQIYSSTNYLFKVVENFTDILKNDLLKEYQYVCTNMMACLSALSKEDLDSAYKNYLQTYHAVKILYNDCVDSIIDIAYQKLKFLSYYSSEQGFSVVSFYKNYYKIIEYLNNIRDKIAQSRALINNWNKRKEVYENIIKSNEFHEIIRFLSDYEIIKSEMRLYAEKNYENSKKELKKEKRDFVTYVCTIICAIGAFLSIIISIFNIN